MRRLKWIKNNEDDNWVPSGGRRKALIPSHSSSLTSPMGLAVLKRYAAKGKAKYQGQFLKKLTRFDLRDSANWHVRARVGVNMYDWIRLTEVYKSKNTKRDIRVLHFGHKLSAAEFYDKGPKSFINKKINKLVKKSEQIAERCRLNACFNNSLKAGKRCLLQNVMLSISQKI